MVDLITKFTDTLNVQYFYLQNHLEKCVYWKTERSENKWKTEGCRRKKDTTNNCRLICECNHLTAFAIIDISGNLVRF